MLMTNSTNPSAHKYNSVYYYSKSRSFNTVKYNSEAAEDEKRERTAENERLEYVAATRAREAMIFMPPIKSPWINSESDAEVYLMEIGERAAEKPETEELPPTEPMFELSEEQKKSVYMTVNPSRMEGAHKSKAEKAAREESDNYVFEGEGNAEDKAGDENVLSSAVDDDDAALESTDKKEKIRADYLGTAMHRMFELTVNRFISEGKDKTKLSEYLNDAVNQALIEGMDDMDDVNKYEKRLKAFAAEFEKDSALHDRIASADTVYTELPFSFFVNEAEAKELSDCLSVGKHKVEVSDGDWVNGTADLVLVKDGVVTVLDYKSNKNKFNIPDFIGELREQYKGQLALYAFAMRKLLGTDKVETDIVNYRTEV